jgi:hypothetical protein
MAPQPLSRVSRDAKIRYGAVLLARPFHAFLVVDTINLGSVVEFAWSKILASLLGAEPERGMAM